MKSKDSNPASQRNVCKGTAKLRTPLLSLLLALAMSGLAQQSYDGSKPLFNGKDLSGWRPRHTSKPNGWHAQDGSLINTSPSNDLVTEETFDDFELHYEYRITPGGNSGVFLRGRYEIQILDDCGTPPSLTGSGSIYKLIAPVENASKSANAWQTIDVKVVGKTVSVTLNGKKVVSDGILRRPSATALDNNVDQPGPILLQGTYSGVSFRSLRIKSLPSAKAGGLAGKGTSVIGTSGFRTIPDSKTRVATPGKPASLGATQTDPGRRGGRTFVPTIPQQTATNQIKKTATDNHIHWPDKAEKFTGLLLPDVGPCWVVYDYRTVRAVGYDPHVIWVGGAPVKQTVRASLLFDQVSAQNWLEVCSGKDQDDRLASDRPPRMIRCATTRSAVTAMVDPPRVDSWRQACPHLPVLIRTRVEDLQSHMASQVWQSGKNEAWIPVNLKQIVLLTSTHKNALASDGRKKGAHEIDQERESGVPSVPATQMDASGVILTATGFQISDLTSNAVAPFSTAVGVRFWVRRVLADDMEISKPLEALWNSRSGGRGQSGGLQSLWLGHGRRSLRVCGGTGQGFEFFNKEDNDLLFDGKWHAVELTFGRHQAAAWIDNTARSNGALPALKEELGVSVGGGAVLLANVQVLQTEPTQNRPKRSY